MYISLVLLIVFLGFVFYFLFTEFERKNIDLESSFKNIEELEYKNKIDERFISAIGYHMHNFGSFLGKSKNTFTDEENQKIASLFMYIRIMKDSVNFRDIKEIYNIVNISDSLKADIKEKKENLTDIEFIDMKYKLILLGFMQITLETRGFDKVFGDIYPKNIEELKSQIIYYS